MIIVRAPTRLEFLGGGTDMAYFYRHHPGRVLNAALNRYNYLTVSPEFEGKIKVRYSKNERADRPSEVGHTRVRAALDYFKIKKGIEIVSIGDIPSGSGLGSSGSFTVGLVQALSHYLGRSLSPREIAETACYLEIDILKEPIGKQDQYAAAFGGLNLMVFRKDGRVVLKPLNLRSKLIEKLEDYLLLVYTGKTRLSRNILEEQKKDLVRKIPFLKQMADIAQEGAVLLKQGDLRGFAETLEKEWQIKKNLAPISNHYIEQMYRQAIELGAWGGRISGAGAGGFMILIVPPGKQKVIKSAFKNCIILKPGIVHQGSQVIFKG